MKSNLFFWGCALVFFMVESDNEFTMPQKKKPRVSKQKLGTHLAQNCQEILALCADQISQLAHIQQNCLSDDNEERLHGLSIAQLEACVHCSDDLLQTLANSKKQIEQDFTRVKKSVH